MSSFPSKWMLSYLNGWATSCCKFVRVYNARSLTTATGTSYESMLDSVLHARDRWLKPHGLMVPSQTSILLAAADLTDFTHDRVDFWNDVYG